MNLLDDMNRPARTFNCKVDTVMQGLDKADAEKLAELVMDTSWPVKTLSRELVKRGVMISETPIYAHRDKACKCWKI